MAAMTLSHEEAVAVQHRHEAHIMGLPGVTGIGVKLVGGALVLEVTVARGHHVPAELAGQDAIDGVPLTVVERSYDLQ
jgi:hypothetical protein